jgi:hypothetical protein
MTNEFDRVRSAFRSSLPGRLLIAGSDAIRAALRTSMVVSAVRAALVRHDAAVIVRFGATAIAIAAAIQPLLIVMMPLAARPALSPISYAGVAALATTAAWNAERVVTAWRSSRPARLLR